MILYHGTVEAFLPSIERGGLKYTPEHSFEGAHYADPEFGLEPEPMRMKRGVYVTTNEQTAIAFAQYKAVWLCAPAGLVMMGEKGDNSFHIFKMKDEGKPIFTKPVVLTLDLPEDIKLEPDEDSGRDEMFWLPEAIPPSAIKAISHPEEKKMWNDPKLKKINKLLRASAVHNSMFGIL